MPKEVYRDTGLITGTHHGATSSVTLRSTKHDFEVCYAASRLISNDSDGSSGVVRSFTGFDVTAGYSTLTATLSGGSLNKWTRNASFTLYVTGAANTRISSTEVCKQSGFAYPYDILVNGEHPDEADIDQHQMTISRRKR